MRIYCHRAAFKVQIIGSVIEQKSRTKISVSDVFDAVEKVLGIYKYELLSPVRTEDIADARSIAMKLVKEFNPKYGLCKMGLIFNRDHSTIGHNINKKFNDLYVSDPVYKKKYEAIKKLLEGTK